MSSLSMVGYRIWNSTQPNMLKIWKQSLQHWKALALAWCILQTVHSWTDRFAIFQLECFVLCRHAACATLIKQDEHATACSSGHIKLVPTNLYLLVMQAVIHHWTFSIDSEFWTAFNSVTDRSMFFDVKQLPDLKSPIYLGAVKWLRNSLSSCGNTSQNEW